MKALKSDKNQSRDGKISKMSMIKQMLSNKKVLRPKQPQIDLEQENPEVPVNGPKYFQEDWLKEQQAENQDLIDYIVDCCRSLRGQTEANGKDLNEAPLERPDLELVIGKIKSMCQEFAEIRQRIQSEITEELINSIDDAQALKKVLMSFYLKSAKLGVKLEGQGSLEAVLQPKRLKTPTSRDWSSSTHKQSASTESHKATGSTITKKPISIVAAPVQMDEFSLSDPFSGTPSLKKKNQPKQSLGKRARERSVDGRSRGSSSSSSEDSDNLQIRIPSDHERAEEISNVDTTDRPAQVDRRPEEKSMASATTNLISPLPTETITASLIAEELKDIVGHFTVSHSSKVTPETAPGLPSTVSAEADLADELREIEESFNQIRAEKRKSKTTLTGVLQSQSVLDHNSTLLAQYQELESMEKTCVNILDECVKDLDLENRISQEKDKDRNAFKSSKFKQGKMDSYFIKPRDAASPSVSDSLTLPANQSILKQFTAAMSPVPAFSRTASSQLNPVKPKTEIELLLKATKKITADVVKKILKRYEINDKALDWFIKTCYIIIPYTNECMRLVIDKNRFLEFAFLRNRLTLNTRVPTDQDFSLLPEEQQFFGFLDGLDSTLGLDQLQSLTVNPKFKVRYSGLYFLDKNVVKTLNYISQTRISTYLELRTIGATASKPWTCDDYDILKFDDAKCVVSLSENTLQFDFSVKTMNLKSIDLLHQYKYDILQNFDISYTKLHAVDANNFMVFGTKTNKAAQIPGRDPAWEIYIEIQLWEMTKKKTPRMRNLVSSNLFEQFSKITIDFCSIWTHENHRMIYAIDTANNVITYFHYDPNNPEEKLKCCQSADSKVFKDGVRVGAVSALGHFLGLSEKEGYFHEISDKSTTTTPALAMHKQSSESAPPGTAAPEPLGPATK